MYAAFYGHDDAARLLISFGAKVNLRNLSGMTAVHWCSQPGRESTLQLLLAHGAKPDIQDNRGQTALHLASRRGYLDLVRILIKAKANLSLKTCEDLECNTPLHEAVLSNDQEVVRALLLAGANVGARNLLDRTAVHRAAYRGYTEVCQLLLDYGCPLDVQDRNGRTALHWAAFFGQLDTIRYLVDKCGASLTIRDKINVTPVQMAKFKKHEATCAFFAQRHGTLKA
jgi:ankyrin repeat protein